MEAPSAILERLLAQDVGQREVYYLKLSRDFFDGDWTYEEMADIEADFERDFRAAVEQISTVWGAPAFTGDRTHSNFPDFFEAAELAYWRQGNRLALIWWDHPDKELPVVLALEVLGTSE
ncbi:MAG: hypothetical protein U0800_02210 [Isosphaeraceae bacterium]